MFIYRYLIPGLWLAWLAYWRISAADVKAAQRYESPASRAAHLVPLLIAAVLPFWNELRQSARIQSSLRGVNAAVIGILVAAFIRPVWSSAVHSAFDLILALVSFALLLRYKLPPWIIVVSVASISAIASATLGL